MDLVLLVVAAAVLLTTAYLTYGRILARLFQLDPAAQTPAVKFRDDVDYSPIEPKFLLSQHFSAIAAAGPIAGPILAGMAFGWLPALIWILVGAIFIGGVHDMAALVASVRHKARSIAEVVRDHMSHRSYLMFLAFVWIALIYIIVAFTDLTAQTFLTDQKLVKPASSAAGAAAENAAARAGSAVANAPQEAVEIVRGAGIATSSMLYLLLPIVMGLLLRYTKLTVGWATVIFLPLVALTIWGGQQIPFDLGATLGINQDQAHKVWDVLLLVYCLVASVVPVWLLLQPRGHLGGYFLYVALGGGALGIVLGGLFGSQAVAIRYPYFLGWEAAGAGPLLPVLFISIACGACSGFHSIIASGTTCKQLKSETDAKPIAYGAMLMEAMVAVLSLSCVIILSEADLKTAGTPDQIYARGLGQFLAVLGIPSWFGVPFAAMAFATFVYDTLDICTRLGRYILQELTGWKTGFGKWLATGITAGAPLLFILQKMTDAAGKPMPLWRVFWQLFGASNQLLAALTLLGITVWLWRTRRVAWVWLVTGLPTLFMYTMSVWALALQTKQGFAKGLTWDPRPWIGSVLLVLAALMAVEAILALLKGRTPMAPQREPVPAAA